MTEEFCVVVVVPNHLNKYGLDNRDRKTLTINFNNRVNSNKEQ